MCGVETARDALSGSRKVAKIAKGEGDKIARRGKRGWGFALRVGSRRDQGDLRTIGQSDNRTIER